MKIYRGPRTSKKWDVTDTKPLKKWAENWEPGKQLHLDGTIQKAGQRHTDLGIVFEEEDIAALHDAFQRYLQQRLAELEEREAELSKTNALMQKGLAKINRLTVRHRKSAPSQEQLLDAIQTISAHCARPDLHDLPVELDWIDFDAI
jgi:hypothetical protein